MMTKIKLLLCLALAAGGGVLLFDGPVARLAPARVGGAGARGTTLTRPAVLSTHTSAQKSQVAATVSTKKVDFVKDVKPIFESACAGCHGGAKAQGGLRLDAKEAAFTGGVSGKAILPGDSKGSLLLQRILNHGNMGRMPPIGDALSAAQVGVIRAWIEEGAEWPDESNTAAQAATKAPDFATHVEPIFKASCYSCHAGPQPKAGLRLDVKSLALKGGMSGKVIIAGNSKGSRLIHRVHGLGDEARMPLKGDPLTPQQIDLLSKWIDAGALWPGDADDDSASEAKIEKHWAYVKPARPALPQIKNSSWVRNPIDNFILARLEKEGLVPSLEASKETLIRRVSLDLTGLPPSVREVDDFLADLSPNAYEKLVERLLSSPHYGERWARPWLDMARYADTNGYEKDRRRSIWKYRDWVIDAFNKDMPFDQFTVEQIAGDMLPDATVEQKVASGFNRNAMTNEEGGVDQQEALYETIIDRVSTTSTVWLGSTVACAQCHNHKYDPFTQKEFFQLYAFFAKPDYKMQGDANISEEKLVEPILEMPTPAQAAKRESLEAELGKHRETLKAQTPELEAAQMNWEREVASAHQRWTTLEPSRVSSTGGSTLTASPDKSVLVSGTNPFKDGYIFESKSSLKNITAVRLEVLPDASLPRGGPGRDTYGNFELSAFGVEISPTNDALKSETLAFREAIGDDGRGGMEAKNLVPHGSKYEPKGWEIDATREETRLARQAVFVAEKPFGFANGTSVKINLKHEAPDGKQGLGRFRLSVTTAPNPATIVNIPAKLRPLLDVPVERRSDKQKTQLSDFYRTVAPSLKATRDRIAVIQDSLKKLGIVSTLVMSERPSYERPSTHLRVRGGFLNLGEKVYANVPAVLHSLPEKELPNRLGFARWLVDENNPLVARVAANRFWEQFFGRGLVETSEDFGTQGERPTHPELLDWLATEFVGRKWSTKAINRLIVTSSAYRQSSKVSAGVLERDPYNKLLARGARVRLEGEMIRDVALASSGLLSRKIGGPSVFPFQPEGVWSIPYNDDKWQMSKGDDRFRRGLYTFWRRTSPYPTLMNFDATSREFCTVRRVRTNTPLQALSTLNDPAFFEMARALAGRVIREAAPDLRERIIYGFRLCVSRRPKEAEVEQLIALYNEQLQHFTKEASAAEKVVKMSDAVSGTASAPEMAAWTMVANVLLNLDETVTKE
ncbi:MAG: PSD1 and planctomycete cytochrome C domain-containing protein [Acidobacteriota bacterium]|nr:PSD1 and planctomycete cytochrome C domain-containing protein [Acidobacteriota bacterium]